MQVQVGKGQCGMRETEAGTQTERADFEQVLPGDAGKKGHVLPERSWAPLGQVSRDTCYL